MAHRQVVLGLYKEILRYARFAKAPEGQAPYFEQAKAEFRLNMNASGEDLLQKLVAKAQSKLGFLKVISPRKKGTIATGKQHFVFREGEGLVNTESVKARKTAFMDKRIDPDDLARHKRLLEYVIAAHKKDFMSLYHFYPNALLWLISTGCFDNLANDLLF
jgi:hypothetical protein